MIIVRENSEGLRSGIGRNDGQTAVAEPVHGSALGIAGQGIANPIAAILSGALLAQLVWQNGRAAARIESAVSDTLASNFDLSTGTTAIKDAVMSRLC